MNKAVFLDRDGTIIEDMGYLSDIEGIKPFPEAAKAIKTLNDNGFKVIVITNQSGVARKLVTEDKVRQINQKVIDLFKSKGADLKGAYYCPHHPQIGEEPYKKNCNCRKPGPGMILAAAKEHDIDLKRSFMVGDKRSDVGAGKNCGLKTVFLTSSIFASKDEVKADYFAADMMQAAEWILKEEGKR